MRLLRKILGWLYARMGYRRGTEARDGLELFPSNSEFAAQIEVAEDVMHEWRDVLRKLGE